MYIYTYEVYVYIDTHIHRPHTHTHIYIYMYTYAYTYFALHYICDGHSNLLFWTLGWAGMNVRWLCGQTSDLLVAFHFMDCTKQ